MIYLTIFPKLSQVANNLPGMRNEIWFLCRSYSKYYRVLGISDNSDQETVRKAFLELCKKYHPDAAPAGTDPELFPKIEEAYRVLQKKFSEDRRKVNDGLGEYGLYYEEKVEEHDIKHTAPQHRQYLSYEGIGMGSPSQRQQQYEQFRAHQAAQAVREHKLGKIQSGEETALVKSGKKIQTRFGMDRLVEDLIQESMAKGEFSNLSGKGKPLKQGNFNPYVDFTTHKMNQIMIDNGFVPEWITLQKEIQSEIDRIRKLLDKKLKSERDLDDVLGYMDNDVKALNKKINFFNLVVPILKRQMVCFNLEKEAENILKKRSQ